MKRFIPLALLAVLILLCSHRAAFAAPEAGVAEHAQTDAAASHVAAAGHGAVPGDQKELIEFHPTTAIWTIVIFVLLLVVLYPTAWKSVLKGLQAREERIRKDIADAEAARAKAEESMKQYATQLATAEEKVRELLAKATVDGEKIAANIRDTATHEAESIRTRATADIQTAKKQAITEIHNETAILATSIAEKIIRKSLNVDDQRDLVRQSLEQLQSQSGN